MEKISVVDVYKNSYIVNKIRCKMFAYAWMVGVIGVGSVVLFVAP